MRGSEAQAGVLDLGAQGFPAWFAGEKQFGRKWPKRRGQRGMELDRVVLSARSSLRAGYAEQFADFQLRCSRVDDQGNLARIGVRRFGFRQKRRRDVERGGVGRRLQCTLPFDELFLDRFENLAEVRELLGAHVIFPRLGHIGSEVFLDQFFYHVVLRSADEKTD